MQKEGAFSVFQNKRRGKKKNGRSGRRREKKNEEKGGRLKKSIFSLSLLLTSFFFLSLSSLSFTARQSTSTLRCLLALAPHALRLHTLALARELRRAVRRDGEHAPRHARDVVVALARREGQRELAALSGGFRGNSDGVGAGGLGDSLLLLADLGDEVAARGAGLLSVGREGGREEGRKEEKKKERVR